MKKENKKGQWKQVLALVPFLLIGAICGVMMVRYLDRIVTPGSSMGTEVLSMLALFLLMYVGIFLQIIVHEAGHLVFGLLTGYRFSSFRIMNFIWVKQNGNLHFRRLSIAGTGGQCLMVPPDLVDGRLPYVLYNLGGSLMNVLFSGLCLLIAVICTSAFLDTVLGMFSIIGFAFALINGIPMRMGTIDNDGYNALSLGKEPAALRAFWLQMKISEQTSAGVRLKDMPADWFEVPTDEAMANSMIGALGVFAANRMMDAHDFSEADRLMEHLLRLKSGIVGLYKSMMTCDRIYCELISENRPEVVTGMLTKDQKKFMKSMKTYPSVLRTEYALALLSEQNEMKTAQLLSQFEKMAKTYPYPSDIASERELMQLALEHKNSL